MSSFQETAKELIDKGSEFMSGLASTAGDVAAKARIKMKIADLVLEENKLMSTSSWQMIRRFAQRMPSS